MAHQILAPNKVKHFTFIGATCTSLDALSCGLKKSTMALGVITPVDPPLCQGRNHVFKVGGPIPWSRLLYKTKYGYCTQFRALQSVT